MITIEKIVQKLPERFNAEQAGDLTAVFQFQVSDAQPFFISIDQGTCTGSFGEHDDPNVVLHLDEQTLIGIVSGEIGGMGAFMKGTLRAEGNVMLATKLGKLFSTQA